MIVILMGVSGAGKTTIGKKLAQKLKVDFYDGDDFHPKSNIDKMSNGIPLEDNDRIPWLNILRSKIEKLLDENKSAIFAISALKKKYRDILKNKNNEILFVYLRGDYDSIEKRMENRKGHFMRKQLLESQFKALEEPEDAIVISITEKPDEIVDFIENKIRIKQ